MVACVVHSQQVEGLEEKLSVWEPGEVLASTGVYASVKVFVQDEQDVAAGVLDQQDEGLEEEFSVSGQWMMSTGREGGEGH